MQPFKTVLSIVIFTISALLTAGQNTDSLKIKIDQLLAQKDFKAAIPLAQQYRLATQKIVGEQSSQFAAILNLQGLLAANVGNFAEAETLYLDGLALTKKLVGPNHLDYSHCLTQLGELYLNKGDFKNALPYWLEALPIQKKILGTDNADYATTLNQLGELYFNLGNYKLAAPYFLEALPIRKKVLGEKHPDYATSVSNLGAVYSKLGEYKTAEPYYLKGLAIRKKILGSHHPDYALSLNNLGALYAKMGEFGKAATCYIEALAIRKKAFGTNNTDYASSLNNLAVLYARMGDYKKAVPLNEEALAIRKKLLGSQHADYASSLNNLAGNYLELADYPKAAAYYEEVLPIRKKILGAAHPVYATVLNNLGSAYYRMGDYKKAEPYYQEALTIREKALGKQHPDYASSLNNLANNYCEMGDYPKAISNYVDALTIIKKTLGTEHNAYGRALSNCGVVCARMGDYKKAIAYYEEALGIQKKSVGATHIDYAKALMNMGSLYADMGNFKKALPFNLEALAILEKEPYNTQPEYANVLNNLGGNYADMEDYPKASAYYLAALTLRKKILGTEHLDYTKSLNSLGNLYANMGELQKAQTYYNTALGIEKKTLGTAHPFYANTLNNLGNNYCDMGDYKNAQPYYLEALATREKTLGKAHPQYAISLNNLGVLYYNLGELKKCFTILREATSLFNSNTNRYLDFLTEQEQERYLHTVSYQSKIYQSFFYKSFPQFLSEAATLYDNELQNKHLILRSSLQVTNAINNSGDTNLVHCFEKLSDIKKQLAKRVSLSNADADDTLQRLEAEAENLDKQLIAQSAIYRHQHQQAQANWKAVQQSLQPNEAAVELVSFPYYAAHRWTDSVLYAALVIRKNDSLPHYVYLFEEQQLKSILKKQEGELEQTYLNKLYQPNSDGHNKLYQLIWQPLDSVLKGATTVYAAPTGLLHTLSLGAIPSADSQTIANKYGLQIWSTTADIINKKDVHIDSKSIQQALVFGGINYDVASSKTLDITGPSAKSIAANLTNDAIRSAAGKWNALDGALQEASAIAQQFRDQKIDTHLYSDSTATETLFKNMPLANNSVLHIATHGFFFGAMTKKNTAERAVLEDKNQRDFTTAANIELRSGLIFAGANPSWIDPNYITSASDDGILNSYEIASLNLSKADLVVLSACETGLGDIKGSEGVFGLQRSFKLAGAKNIIMSLWKVPDEKTKELMQAFYQYCFSGKSVSAAFHAAQEMLKNKYPASPYSWAGFTLLQ